MPRPKRKAAEIAHTRQHIVDAAARVFARCGVAGATMQEIAQESGFSPASLYGYFDGKQAILRALAQSVHDESEALLRRPLPESLDFRQRVELLLLRQTTWFEERFHDFVVFSRDDSLRVVLEEEGPAPPDHLASLTAWIEANAQPGELGAVTPEEAAYVLWGLARAFYVRWIYTQSDQPASALVSRIVGYFFNGVLGTGAKPAG